MEVHMSAFETVFFFCHQAEDGCNKVLAGTLAYKHSLRDDLLRNICQLRRHFLTRSCCL